MVNVVYYRPQNSGESVMTLEKSKSKESFKKNVKEEVKSGKPVKQAIAYSEKKGKKK